MSASIKSVSGDTVTLEVTVTLNDSMLDSEQAIQSSLNEAGSLATGEAFKRFDTDGSRLEIGGEKWFSKGEVNNLYRGFKWRSGAGFLFIRCYPYK